MFVKLFTQILDSSIADDRRLRHFFTDLLLCADGSGTVMMTEQAIARRIGATVDEVMWGLAELERADPHSKNPAYKGRRIEKMQGSGYGWKILNYEHYRAMKDAAQLREVANERVRRFREKKKRRCNADVTHGNACNAMQKQSTDAASEATKSVGAFAPEGDRAAEIYDAYPKKVAKPEALKAIKKSLSSPPLGTSAETWPDALLEIVRRYAAERKGEEPRFTPNPATWFNQRRFEDDPSTWKRPLPAGNGKPIQRMEIVEFESLER